jgi:hypothetical protein
MSLLSSTTKTSGTRIFVPGARIRLESTYLRHDICVIHASLLRDVSARSTLEACMKYGLLWLLGIPIPVLIVVYLLFHH